MFRYSNLGLVARYCSNHDVESRLQCTLAKSNVTIIVTYQLSIFQGFYTGRGDYMIGVLDG